MRAVILIALHSWAWVHPARPAFAEEPTQKAERLMAQRDFRGAIQQFRWAFVQTRDPELLVQIGECHVLLGEVDAAKSFLEKFLSTSPAPARRRAIERRLQEFARNADRPERLSPPPAPPVTATTPKEAYALADDAYRNGRYEVAANAFEAAYKLSSAPAILYDIGQSYRRLWETQHQLMHLQKARVAYAAFISQAPTAQLRPIAEKFASPKRQVG